MTTDEQVLAQIDAAFGDVERPEHFTDYSHCCECAEHDALLCARDRDSLCLADVGNPGWDPLCFASAQGIAYYFPALARLALASPGNDYEWYADQLVFHLDSGGRENRFYGYCNDRQRGAVVSFLAHVIESRTELIEDHGSSDDILRCYALWDRRPGSWTGMTGRGREGSACPYP